MSEDEDSPPGFLPESVAITRIDDLLAQMRFHEVPKRALFSIPFHLAEGFTIGVKGYALGSMHSLAKYNIKICFRYGLVTEQRKGTYKYFVDRGDGMEVVNTRTDYVDKV